MMSGEKRRFDEETIDCLAQCPKKWNSETYQHLIFIYPHKYCMEETLKNKMRIMLNRSQSPVKKARPSTFQR